jgi:GH35 family endo-1,4-beta-xylanase
MLVYPASFRAAAEARGLLIGSMVDEGERFNATLLREFNSLSAGGQMSWSQIDCCGYEGADALVKSAVDHQMKMKGQVLIWHGSLPD